MLKKLMRVFRPKNRPLGVPILDGSDGDFEKQVVKSYNRLNETLNSNWGKILAKAYETIGPVVLKEKYDIELNEIFIEENTKSIIDNRTMVDLAESIHDTLVNIDEVMPFMMTSKNMKFKDVYNKYQKLQTMLDIIYDIIMKIKNK